MKKQHKDQETQAQQSIDAVFELLSLVSRQDRDLYRWDYSGPLEELDPDTVIITRLSHSSAAFPVGD